MGFTAPANAGCLARRARAELSRIFARIIQARRQSKAGEEDILQCFIDSRYEKVRGHPNLEPSHHPTLPLPVALR